jgi:hypothetical protein
MFLYRAIVTQFIFFRTELNLIKHLGAYLSAYSSVKLVKLGCMPESFISLNQSFNWKTKCLAFCIFLFQLIIFDLHRTFVEQCCQNMSSFATCGDGRFKCGVYQLFSNIFLILWLKV